MARYADQHQYSIHPTKTKIVENNKSNNLHHHWQLNENLLEVSDTTTHLGLIRSIKSENEINIDERIKLTRRTKYPLLGSGLHGTN